MLMAGNGRFDLMFGAGCALGSARSVSADADVRGAHRADVAIRGRAGELQAKQLSTGAG